MFDNVALNQVQGPPGEGTYGAWSVEGNCLRFKGHDDLQRELQCGVTVGALGVNWSEKHVMDTSENRAALEAAVLRPWFKDEISERLWTE